MNHNQVTVMEQRREEILALMKDGKLRLALWFALHFGVAERTIYKDMAALKARGIQGERGIGYIWRPK